MPLKQTIQGETPYRCGVDSNHRAGLLHPVKRGSFVLHVCSECLVDEPRLARAFREAAEDLRATIAARR